MNIFKSPRKPAYLLKWLALSLPFVFLISAYTKASSLLFPDILAEPVVPVQQEASSLAFTSCLFVLSIRSVSLFQLDINHNPLSPEAFQREAPDDWSPLQQEDDITPYWAKEFNRLVEGHISTEKEQHSFFILEHHKPTSTPILPNKPDDVTPSCIPEEPFNDDVVVLYFPQEQNSLFEFDTIGCNDEDNEASTESTQRDETAVSQSRADTVTPRLTIIYPSGKRTKEQKLEFEAQQALKKLQDPKSLDHIISALSMLIDLLKQQHNTVNINIAHTIKEDEENSYKYCDYPVYKRHKKTRWIDKKKSYQRTNHHATNSFTKHREPFKLILIETLENIKQRRNIIEVLSILWKIPASIMMYTNDPAHQHNYNIYREEILRSRHHEKEKPPSRAAICEIHTVKTNSFGVAELESSILNCLEPMIKTSHYYTEKAEMPSEKDNPIYTTNSKMGIPYIAGTSGMCNAFYSFYYLTDLDLYSGLGRELAEIISAFIIGIGAHSYQECYDSFNISYDGHQEFLGRQKQKAGIKKAMMRCLCRCLPRGSEE